MYLYPLQTLSLPELLILPICICIFFKLILFFKKRDLKKEKYIQSVLTNSDLNYILSAIKITGKRILVKSVSIIEEQKLIRKSCKIKLSTGFYKSQEFFRIKMEIKNFDADSFESTIDQFSNELVKSISELSQSKKIIYFMQLDNACPYPSCTINSTNKKYPISIRLCCGESMIGMPFQRLLVLDFSCISE